MIRKEKSRIKRQASKKKIENGSTDIQNSDNDPDEKLSYADYVDKNFSTGTARFTSYCDRIMKYQEYLYGPGWAVGTNVSQNEQNDKECVEDCESSCIDGVDESQNEIIASSCDEEELEDQSMSSFLRGLKELNRKMTELRKAHFPTLSDPIVSTKPSASVSGEENLSSGRDMVVLSPEEDEVTLSASEDCHSIITVDSDDEQKGTSTAPIIVEEGKNEEDEDVVIVSSEIAPKKCTCGKSNKLLNNNNTTTISVPDTVVQKLPLTSSSATDSSKDIISLVSEPHSLYQGDFIQIDPGSDKLHTSPQADSENRKPQDSHQPSTVPALRVVHAHPELNQPMFEPGKFYGRYTSQQYQNCQPIRPASPLATVYSNTTVYKDNFLDNSYRIQQVQQVNLVPNVAQPIGITTSSYNWDGHEQGPINNLSCTNVSYDPSQDNDDMVVMSRAYNNTVTATKCGKCCTCKKT